MKKLGILFIYVFSFLAAFAFGMGCGLAISDNQARKSAIDDEYLDMCELAIQEDYDCQIKTIDNHNIKKGEVTYLCVKNNDETNSFIIVLELKKVAPFRYDWVVVE